MRRWNAPVVAMAASLALGLGVGAPALADSLVADGRVFEMVSPPDKNGGDVGGLEQPQFQAAADGEGVIYDSLTSFAGSQSAELISQYLSRRGLDGWSTQGISPPASRSPSVSFSLPYEAFSSDLSAGVLAWSEPGLTPGARPGYRNLYVRDNRDGSYGLVTVLTPANESESRFVGASADYSHVVFEAGDALVEGAIANSRNVYEWTAGRISLVSVMPQSTTGAEGAGAGNGNGETRGAVSSDGSRVFWTDGGGQLYVREDGVRTVKVNSSQSSPSAGDGVADFLGATPDGARAFFTDTTPLTGAPDDAGGLYVFEAGSGRLSDLTPDGGSEPEVQGVLGYGDEGSAVYFVAGADLASGASAGASNLYLSRDGTLSFLATLSSEDSNDWVSQPTNHHAAVSPDGMAVVFMSNASLTGYENTDVTSGKPDSEVFQYSVATGRMYCVSCNPTGEAPSGPSRIPTWQNASYNPRYLSEDASRVFFDTFDGLAVRDTNGAEDVYEWERGGGCTRAEGCLYPISGASGPGQSLFGDATPDGGDVFFTTAARLTPADVDENVDLYDARVGGGLPRPPVQGPCSGEACVGPLSPAPRSESPFNTLEAPPGEELPAPSRGRLTLVLGKGAAAQIARSARLTFHVLVSRAGRLTARLTVDGGGRPRQIAFATKRAARPGSVEVVLKPRRAALTRYAVHGRLAVVVTVAFSGSTQARRLMVTLAGRGRQS